MRALAIAMRRLDPKEVALLHLLRSLDKPVDIAFFNRLGPPQSEGWSHGTFSQEISGGVLQGERPAGCAGGSLLLAARQAGIVDEEDENGKVAICGAAVQLARHLPPLVESAKRLSGEGDWRADVAREKLKTALGRAADREIKNDSVEIVNGELRWGDQPFRARPAWWNGRSVSVASGDEPNKAPKRGRPVHPAAFRGCASHSRWPGCRPLERCGRPGPYPWRSFCGSRVDAGSDCAKLAGSWGFLARQEAEGRKWYRLAPRSAGS